MSQNQGDPQAGAFPQDDPAAILLAQQLAAAQQQLMQQAAGTVDVNMDSIAGIFNFDQQATATNVVPPMLLSQMTEQTQQPNWDGGANAQVDLQTLLAMQLMQTQPAAMGLVGAAPEAAPKKEKTQMLHFHLTDLYKLRKIKYTLNVDDIKKKQLRSAEYIYTFERRTKEEVLPLLQQAMDDGHTKVYVDLGFYAKQLLVTELSEMQKDETTGQYQVKRNVPLPDVQPTFGTMLSLKGVRPGGPKLMNACQDLMTLSQRRTWYVTPEMQAQLMRVWMTSSSNTEDNELITDDYQPQINVSQDLNSIAFAEREINYYMHADPEQAENDGQQTQSALIEPSQQRILARKPEIHLKFSQLKLKKISAEDAYEQQIQPELKIRLVVGASETCPDASPQALSDFGLRMIEYKPRVSTYQDQSLAAGYQSTSTQDSEMHHDSENDPGVYLITDDAYEASQLWLPQVFGTTRDAIAWTMNYVVDKGLKVISAGNLQGVKQLDGSRTMYTFKVKRDEQRAKNCGLMLADKLGFAIGNFSSTSIRAPDGTKLGNAFFLTPFKLAQFKSTQFYAKQIEQALSSVESIVEVSHGCREWHNRHDSKGRPIKRDQLKMVYLPNLFRAKSTKMSFDFADSVHLVDEESLLPRDIIEKRHRTQKMLASCLAFDFFGFQVWEESVEDAWLMTAIRQHIGNIYMRQRCGQSFYKYTIAKIMDKFYEAVQAGAERYSLTSQYLAHFSELTQNEDMFYWKCQLIMHVMEQLIQYHFFQNVVRDLYKRADPLVTTSIFRKVLPHGIKFSDIQQYWVRSTSCPLIVCHSQIPKKNTHVDLVLTQHSCVKPMLVMRKFVDSEDVAPHELCYSGKLIMNQCAATQDKHQTFQVEQQREYLRWIHHDVKVNIFQTDGSDIHVQREKLTLRQAESVVRQQFQLQCKAKRAQAKKNPRSFLTDQVNLIVQQLETSERKRQASYTQVPKSALARKQFRENMLLEKKKEIVEHAEQLYKNISDNNQWRFELSDQEEDETDNTFGNETNLLFKKYESPILWVRVDPEIELIRRVKVIQSKQSWLFQLLKERDFVGQVEACKELARYSDQVVYDTLQSVVKNERFFFKVRKHALRSLEKINVREFSNVLSREKQFLTKYFNLKNFREEIGFYRSNDFSNVLEYYVKCYLVRALATSKEKRMQLSPQAEEHFTAQVQQVLNMKMPEKEGIPVAQEPNTSKEETKPKATKNAVEPAPKETRVTQEQSYLNFTMAQQHMQTSTGDVSQILLRLLQENDNSENAFDDAYYLAKLLSNLGKLDDFSAMPVIAKEALKYLQIDTISRRSPCRVLSKGAIKCYFNIRKQIWRFRHLKQPFLMAQDTVICQQFIAETEATLVKIKQRLDHELCQRDSSFDLRCFIFEKSIKNLFEYSVAPQVGHAELAIPDGFLDTVQTILKGVDQTIKAGDLQFVSAQLSMIASYLENKMVSKLNFKETLLPNDQSCNLIASYLVDLFSQQKFISLHSSVVTHAKRLFAVLFGADGVPIPLRFAQTQRNIEAPYLVTHIQEWSLTEQQQQAKRKQAGEMEEEVKPDEPQFAPAVPEQDLDAANLQQDQLAMILQNAAAQIQQNLSGLFMPNMVPGFDQAQEQAALPVGFEQNLQQAMSQMPVATDVAMDVDVAEEHDQQVDGKDDDLENGIIMINNDEGAEDSYNNDDVDVAEEGEDMNKWSASDEVYSDNDNANLSDQQEEQNNIYNVAIDLDVDHEEQEDENMYAQDEMEEASASEAQPSMHVDSYEPVTALNWQERSDRLRGITRNNQSSDDEAERVLHEEKDDFDDVQFTGWRQACKDILYLLYYDPDSGPFVEPLTAADFGGKREYYEYLKIVKRPMDMLTIKKALFRGAFYQGNELFYLDSSEFLEDMHLVFKNCMKYNKKGTVFYRRADSLRKSLQKLEYELRDKLQEPEQY